MLYAGGLLGAVLVLLWLFCIIDVIMTPADECRFLPKLVWLGLVIVLSDLGSAAWLLAGRPWPGGPPLERAGWGRGGRPGAGGARFPEYDRPGRFEATDPEADDAFLAQVRERAQAQRRTEAARRRERERAEIAERERRQQARRPDSGREEPPQDTGEGGAAGRPGAP